MACYCKAWQLFYYWVQGFSTNWTIKTGHPDYSTILAKRFQETCPFSCVFIGKEFVANGQNTNKWPTNVPPETKLSSITCSRHVKGVWLLTPNTIQGGRGLNLNCIFHYKRQSVNVLTRIVCFSYSKTSSVEEILSLQYVTFNITLRSNWKFISVRKKTKQTEALFVKMMSCQT